MATAEKQSLFVEDFRDLLLAAGEGFESVPLTDSMPGIRDLVHEGIQRSFDLGYSPVGEGWPPRKDNLSHPLLIKSGALMAAATGQGAGAVDRVGERSAEVGVNKDGGPRSLQGAAVHQFGYLNIPQRQYLGASEETLLQCEQIIGNEIELKVF